MSLTQTEAIDRLIEAVEAGTLPEAVFHGCSSIRGHWAYTTGIDAEQRTLVFLAYNGDLNAAKALHESLLPGWVWEKRGGELVVQHWAVEYSHTDHDNPARAWLLAILRAHRHQIAAGGECTHCHGRSANDRCLNCGEQQ